MRSWSLFIVKNVCSHQIVKIQNKTKTLRSIRHRLIITTNTLYVFFSINFLETILFVEYDSLHLPTESTMPCRVVLLAFKDFKTNHCSTSTEDMEIFITSTLESSKKKGTSYSRNATTTKERCFVTTKP